MCDLAVDLPRPSLGPSLGASAPVRGGRAATYAGPAAQAPIDPARRRALLGARLPLPVLIYLLCVLVPIGFNLGPLAMTSLRIFLILMVLPLLVKLLMGKFGRLMAPDLFFTLHILWAVAALAVNNPNVVVQQIGSVGVEFLGGYLMGRAYIRTSEDFVALVRWLAFLVLCTTPFAVFEALTGRPLLLELLHRAHLTAVAIVSIDARMGLERVQSGFAHPIHYGLFCSVAFSLAFVALRNVTGTGWRYVSSVIVALSGFLALSSGALLAILLQIALILWAASFARLRGRWWLLIGLFALAYVVVDLLSNRDPLQVFMSYATFSAHNAYWRGIIFEWGMKSVWAHPLYGIGLNDWVRPWYMYSGSMDNFWLVMAVRYGIPGFVVLVLGYVWGIFRVMRRDFEGDAVLARIRRAWVFTFLGLSFTLTTVHVWTNIYSFVFFLFGAGMWLVSAVQSAPDQTPGQSPGQSADPSGGRAPAYSRFEPRQRPHVPN